MKSIKETAKELNVSVNTIRRMIERKDINAVKIATVWRITEEEIEPRNLRSAPRKTGTFVFFNRLTSN